MDDKFMTVLGVADYLKLAERPVCGDAQKRRLRGIRFGCARRFRNPDSAQVLEEQRQIPVLEKTTSSRRPEVRIKEDRL